MAALLTGFRPTLDARWALPRAVAESRTRDAKMAVVHSKRGGERDDPSRVVEERSEFERLNTKRTAIGVLCELLGLAYGRSPAEDLKAVADERRAELA
jgi:hypothetical protein